MVRFGSIRAAVLACGVVLWCVAPAEAQLDEGVRLYEEADFRGALAAFDRALEAGVTQPELARLFLYRAQVRFALGDETEMLRDAARLAGVDPRHELGRAVPPQVRDAFAEAVELGAGLVLDVSAEPMPGGVRIAATVRGDPGDLVQEVRLAGRPAGAAQWTEATGDSLDVAAPSGLAVEYHVSVVGPGGALLRNEGTPSAPLRFGSVATAADPLPDPIVEDENEDDEGGVPLWAMIGGGVLGAALVVAVIVLIASSGGQSDDTQLSSPMFVPP